MFQVFVIKLLCVILDLLLFPNARNPQDTRDKQFLLSSAIAYAIQLERDRIVNDDNI
jgi:hypothetical protein